MSLLDEAKKHIKEDSTVDFVFADVNCNMVAKMKSGSYAFFDDLNSFHRIFDGVFKWQISPFYDFQAQITAMECIVIIKIPY